MGETLVPEEANIRCAKCNSSFPVRHHVPLLTPEPVKHLRRIEALSVEKPGWYRKKQIEYHDKGPYRVHLKRRQDYVGNVLKTIIAQTHMDAVISQARMLDLGCGDGANLRWLKDFGFLLYGLDYNLERAARARRVIPPEVRIALADILHLPIRARAFHFVYCNHVLEHIHDDRQALENIHRILAPDRKSVV